MREVVEILPSKPKKRKTSNTRGESVDKRIMRSKLRDPLHQPKSSTADDADEDGGAADSATAASIAASEEKKIYSIKEASSLGRSSAGRRDWQEKHKKGKFNVKQQKKTAHRTPGTFSKSRKL